MLTRDIISIADLSTGQVGEIHQMTTELSVSFTMDLASQISFSVLDPDFRFMKGNYFLIRREVLYRGSPFEMTSIEVTTSDGGSPLILVEARSKAVQLMKRDKIPEGYRQLSATEFAAMIAARYGLKFFGEPTPTKQTIVKSKASDSDESVWDVLKRLANEAQFLCFESDGILFFCSHQFLLNKLQAPKGGRFVWPTLDLAEPFILMDIPNMRRSDDDPLEADGNLLLERTNAIRLRPGYTANLVGVPTFDGAYLITEVRFNEMSPDPIEVSIRTPEKPKPEKPKSTGQRTGQGKGGSPPPDPPPKPSRTIVADREEERIRKEKQQREREQAIREEQARRQGRAV